MRKGFFFLCTPNTRFGRLYGVHVKTIVKTRRCARPRTAVQYASLTNAVAASVENIKNDGNETIARSHNTTVGIGRAEQKSIVFAEGGETEKNVLGQRKNRTNTTAVERAKTVFSPKYV